MSVRITESIRTAITHRLLDHRFEKERKALLRRENDLALKFYRAIYSAPDRKAMEAVPPGWMLVTTRILITVNRYGYELKLANALPVPIVDQGKRHNVSQIKGGEALAEVFEAFRKAKVDYENEAKALREKTVSTLAGFNTVKSLLGAWPEIKPFVDQLGYSEQKKQLPATIPAELNTSLGLAA